MRRLLPLLLGLAPAVAAGVEQDVRARTDYLHLTDGADGAPGAQLWGYGLRARLRQLADLLGGDLELHVELRAREDLLRAAGTRRGVPEARLTLRDAGPFTLSVGRFGVGEGTALLLVDGAELAARVHDAVELALAGGLRAEDDDLTPDADRPVVAGTARVRIDDWLDGAASASWGRERFAPPNRAAEGQRQRDVIDAALRLLVVPTPTTWIFASAETADVAAWSVPAGDPRTWLLTDQGFALTQVYVQAGHRPWRPLKLDAGWLLQASRFAAAGSTDRFQDITARARWRALPGLRLMARGRARLRDRLVLEDDGGQSTQDELAWRAQGAVELTDAFDLGLAANLGAVHDHEPTRSQTALTGELGWQGAPGHAFAGLRTTLRDPDDTFSTFTPEAPGAQVALDPYSRTVEMAAYARAAAHARWGYVAAQVDYDLAAAQLLAFTQVGVAWR